MKHKAILYTAYSAGLRCGEILNLTITDLRSDDGYLFVRAVKSKKDRHTLLSPVLLDLLRNYYKMYEPKFWLFEGQTGEKYSKSRLPKCFGAQLKQLE